MKVIKSIVTTDAILTYSNIAEDEHPAWLSGTSYNANARVIYNHKIYERIIAGAGTTTPDIDQVNWMYISYTNRYRMFDNILYSTSSQVGGIHFTLTPNQSVDSLAILNVNASSVRVVITDPSLGVIYDTSMDLSSVSDVTDYYSYFYSPLVAKLNTAVFNDLPIAPTATIDVYISAGSALVSVGEVVYGIKKVVGRTNYGTSIGIKSYSRKEFDEFGNVTVVKRKNSKYCEYDIDIDNYMLSDVQRFFSDIDSVPCVFIGNDDLEELVVYGFYSDFKATISFPTVSKCTLRVEGLL